MYHYNFTQQGYIFSPDNKDSTRYVSIFFTNMDPLNCSMKNQVGELVNTSEVSYKCPAIAKYDYNLFW